MARGRKTKSGLDYWLENCHTCSNFEKTCFLHGGVADGSVRMVCGITGDDVVPHKIDGCRRYIHGNPNEVKQEMGNTKNGKEKL